MTESNWRTMEAGPTLDRIVAAALGYRVVNLNDSPNWKIKGASVIILEPGEMVGRETDYDALCKLKKKTYWNEEYAWAVVLDEKWSSDLNNAVKLWKIWPDYRWGVCPDYDDPTKFSATYPGHGDQDAGQEAADEPALAACRAFLAWRKVL